MADAPSTGAPRTTEQKPPWSERRKHPLFRKYVTFSSALGIVLIVLFVLVGLPYLVTSSPGFCSLCHAKDASGWANSTHKQVGCSTCHIESGVKGAALSELGFGQKILRKLGIGREAPLGFEAQPLNAFCDPCHKVRRNISPSGDLVIPHKAHTQLRKVACVDCHRGLVHKQTSIKHNQTSMLGCYRCHDGKKAPNTCSVCHTEKAIPNDHRADDWLQVHSQKEKENPEYCIKCHGWVADYCTECHRRKPRSHITGWPGWRAKHQALFLSERKQGCAQCHDPDMCRSCHPRP